MLAEEKVQDDETSAKVNAMLGNWNAITSDVLQAHENARAIEGLRELARRNPSSIAVVLLLRYGDEESVQRLVAQLHVVNPGKRNAAMRDLSLAANPELFPLLAGDLSRQESADLIIFGDTGMLPLSLASASIMKATILESSVFPAEVKDWAKRLPKVSGGLRDGVRAWWKVNKAAIERGDYQSVVPVEGATSAPPVLPMAAATPAPQTTTVSGTPAAASPSLAAVVSPVPTERNARVWPWLVGILAMVVIMAVALKRRT